MAIRIDNLVSVSPMADGWVVLYPNPDVVEWAPVAAMGLITTTWEEGGKVESWQRAVPLVRVLSDDWGLPDQETEFGLPYQTSLRTSATVLLHWSQVPNYLQEFGKPVEDADDLQDYLNRCRGASVRGLLLVA